MIRRRAQDSTSETYTMMYVSSGLRWEARSTSESPRTISPLLPTDAVTS
ncbi:hypothetical protein [Streptomyces venezuelae]|nr:hypothetical protein [Streptomyces venezuelae]